MDSCVPSLGRPVARDRCSRLIERARSRRHRVHAWLSTERMRLAATPLFQRRAPPLDESSWFLVPGRRPNVGSAKASREQASCGRLRISARAHRGRLRSLVDGRTRGSTLGWCTALTLPTCNFHVFLSPPGTPLRASRCLRPELAERPDCHCARGREQTQHHAQHQYVHSVKVEQDVTLFCAGVSRGCGSPRRAPLTPRPLANGGRCEALREGSVLCNFNNNQRRKKLLLD